MKAIGLLLFALLAQGISQEAAVAPQADTGEHKPCGIDLQASPASEQDTAAFKAILGATNADPDIFLYVSHDSKMKNYGGAISFRCPSENHEIYDTDENWTIYDPDLIQGDAARDFVFAHEIAHHMNGDTSSSRPRSKELESRADYNGIRYLISLGWKEERLLHALDLLNLPQGPQLGYPTIEERKAIVKSLTEFRLKGPTNLQGRVVTPESPSNEELWDSLLNLKFTGSIQFQSVRTLKYVCSIGTPDPKIPSINHFAFFDNCEHGGLRVSFDIRVSPNGTPGYWIQQHADPCPEYAANCAYALKSVGNQLEFWNQDLAADRDGWEKELGEEELFSFEAADPLGGLVRIKARVGGYIFVDGETAQLKGGGNREQAAEFRVLFNPCGGTYFNDGDRLTCE